MFKKQYSKCTFRLPPPPPQFSNDPLTILYYNHNWAATRQTCLPGFLNYRDYQENKNFACSTVNSEKFCEGSIFVKLRGCGVLRK